MRLFLAVLIAITFLSVSGLIGCGQAQEKVKLPDIKPWQPPKVSTDLIKTAGAEPDADGIKLTGVGLAEDGKWLIVRFQGPAKLIQAWNQGSVYLVDEGTGTAYNQIPVAPVIGPLFGKPRDDGQPAYVMLNNINPGLKLGSVVTVILGKYKRENIKIE
jgi:hypothetical protein